MPIRQTVRPHARNSISGCAAKLSPLRKTSWPKQKHDQAVQLVRFGRYVAKVKARLPRDTQHRKYLDLCVAGQTRLPTLQISPSEKQLAPFVAQICSTQRCVVAPDAFAAAPRATPCCSLATMLSVYSHLPLDPLASSMKSQQS